MIFQLFMVDKGYEEQQQEFFLEMADAELDAQNHHAFQ